MKRIAIVASICAISAMANAAGFEEMPREIERPVEAERVAVVPAPVYTRGIQYRPNTQAFPQSPTEYNRQIQQRANVGPKPFNDNSVVQQAQNEDALNRANLINYERSQNISGLNSLPVNPVTGVPNNPGVVDALVK